MPSPHNTYMRLFALIALVVLTNVACSQKNSALAGNNTETISSDKGELQHSDKCVADLQLGEHKLIYQGGMRFDGKRFGAGSAVYATPVIAVDGDNVWIGGKTNSNIVGAFAMEFRKTKDVEDMPIASNVVPFIRVDRFDGWEKQKRVTGLEKVGDKLLVAVTEYYDAAGDAPFSHAYIDKEGKVHGWLKTTAPTIAHTSGWTQKLPEKWHKLLGAPYIMGHSENYPIDSRHSIGPSLYTWDGDIKDTMNVKPWMFFTLKKPMHELRYNRKDVLANRKLLGTIPKEVGDNDVWTVVSHAWGGFVRGDDYIVIGSSGMHHSSGGYKITQMNGKKCGGVCAYDPADYYNYYWVFNMYDILNAKDPWQPKPYKWGKLNLGIAEDIIQLGQSKGLIRGVDYDGEYLYLNINHGDTEISYKPLPVLLKYKFCE